MINLSMVLVNNELKYRLRKLEGNLTNFSAISFLIVLLRSVKWMIRDWKHVPIKVF